MFTKGSFCWFALAAAMVFFAGCSGDETTTIIYYTTPSAGNFPGTPVTASNLAEDAKALSPGGQDVVAVRVFWDGHDQLRAVVLFETRVFLAEDVSQYHEAAGGSLPDRMTTTTRRTYFRHIWAAYFDGSKLTKPVEIVGKNMEQLASTESFVSVDESTLQECDRGEPTPWRNVIDTAAGAFYRSSTTGAFNAGASSATAAARNGDAVILFHCRDVDTETGTDASGNPAPVLLRLRLRLHVAVPRRRGFRRRFRGLSLSDVPGDGARQRAGRIGSRGLSRFPQRRCRDRFFVQDC